MRKKLVSVGLALVLALSLSLVTAAPVAADELPVGPAPKYLTIQSAIDDASPGDTIIVESGTYPEDITIDKPLTIISSGEGSYPIIQGQNIGYQGAVNIASSNVTFGEEGTGFAVWGAGQAAVYFTQPVSGCLIEGNEIVAAPNKNALLTGGGQSNHVIAGNTFTGSPASQLVYVNGQTSVAVASTNVDFIGNEFAGDATGPALGQEATDSKISGNTFATVTGYASLELWGADNTVMGNDFTGDLPSGGKYVMDSSNTYDIDAVLASNTFLRAALVERPGASRLPAIWANIQGAVDAAVAGDTVDVIAGAYPESVTVATADLTLCGANAGVNPVTEARGPESVIQGTGSPIVVMLTASDVTVDGFEVNGSGTVWAGIAEGAPVTGTMVENNIVHEFTGIGICSAAGSSGGSMLSNDVTDAHTGVYLSTGASGFLIEGNWLHGMIRPTDVWSDAGSGVAFEGNNTNVLVTKNTLEDNNFGLYVWSGYGDDYSGTVVSFNDITGSVIAGVQNTGSGTVDARYNWFDDISGPYKNPDGNPSGLGDSIVGNVNFAPWLTRPFETVLEDGIAYFGYPWVHVGTGWNLLSTPIALDSACDTWAEYIELGNGLSVDPEATTYYFDAEIQWYGQVLGDYQLKPCDAIIVKMLAPDIAAICYSPEMSVPSKDLMIGWNLVSLSYWDEMSVGDALHSIAEVTGGLTGYVQVVSPPMNQYPWVYTGYDEEEMLRTKGYWVFMLNDGTLAGFMFTPQSLDYNGEDH